MRYKLSVILPSIRVGNLMYFYTKLKESTSYPLELIVVGPYDPPQELLQNKEVSYIKDHGCPSRCQQIALTHATGEYVTWGADDGCFLKDKLTEAIDFLESNKTSYKDIVTCKYTEGTGANISERMYQDAYYKLSPENRVLARFIPSDYWLINVGIIDTKYAKELGGWDAQFEVTAISHMDFAVRAQRNGSNVFMLPKPIFCCTHLFETTGDHAPIHHSQIGHDEPLFRQVYNSPESVGRIKIDLNNWQRSPSVWRRRFHNEI